MRRYYDSLTRVVASRDDMIYNIPISDLRNTDKVYCLCASTATFNWISLCHRPVDIMTSKKGYGLKIFDKDSRVLGGLVLGEGSEFYGKSSVGGWLALPVEALADSTACWSVLSQNNLNWKEVLDLTCADICEPGSRKWYELETLEDYIPATLAYTGQVAVF